MLWGQTSGHVIAWHVPLGRQGGAPLQFGARLRRPSPFHVRLGRGPVHFITCRHICRSIWTLSLLLLVVRIQFVGRLRSRTRRRQHDARIRLRSCPSAVLLGADNQFGRHLSTWRYTASLSCFRSAAIGGRL